MIISYKRVGGKGMIGGKNIEGVSSERTVSVPSSVNACNSLIPYASLPLSKVDGWMVIAILINAL